MTAVVKNIVAIKNADVVEPEKSALENIVPFGIFPVHPPGECEQHFVEDRFQECAVAFTALFALDLINAPRRPRQDGRIYVVEVPLVRGNFAARVQIPFTHDQLELVLGELDVNERERYAVKREVPRRVPRVFPFVRHRHHALVVKMPPIFVATFQALDRR